PGSGEVESRANLVHCLDGPSITCGLIEDPQCLILVTGGDVQYRGQHAKWHRLGCLLQRSCGGPLRASPGGQLCLTCAAVSGPAAERVPFVVEAPGFIAEGELERLVRTAAPIEPADDRGLQDLQRVSRRGGSPDGTA